MSEAGVSILLVTNSLESGGIERNVRMVATHLPAAFPREVWALLPPTHSQQLPCKTTILRRRAKFDPWLIWRLARTLRRHPGRIIHFYHFASGLHVLLANLLIGRRRRKRMVFSFGSARTSSPLINWYVRLVARYADWVTGNSPSVVRSLVDQGICPERIEVLSNGHDLAAYTRLETKAQLRARLGVPVDAVVLISTGRLTATKRQVDLLDAVAGLAMPVTWRLLILGEGELRGALEKRTAELGLQAHVDFLGHRDNVIDYLLAADLFAFPSETEGLPNSLIEASLAGLPIVACRVDGVRDVVEDGVNGLLVPARDPAALAAAMERLLSEPDLATRLAQAARQRAETRYGLAGMIEQLQRIYQRVLA